MSRPLVLLALTLAVLRAAAYCPRADPAWRALRAPLVLNARVIGLNSTAAQLRVQRVLRRPPGGRWPRRDRNILLLISDDFPASCRTKLDGPLLVGKGYVVFAERRDRDSAVALGPPLPRNADLMRRLRRVLAQGYIRPPKVKKMKSISIAVGKQAIFDCSVTGRPPPRVTWYINDKPVKQSALRRLRVQTYRHSSKLIVKNATVADSGRVVCSARGVGGVPAVTSAILTVVDINAPTTTPTPSVDTKILGTPCPMPNPTSYCMNGGTCLYFEKIGESACTCPEGYEGQRCERKDVPHETSMYHSFSCKLGLSTTYYC